MSDSKESKFSRRPPDSAFQQQRLKAWQPLLTPFYVIGTFLIVGLLFVIIGSIVLITSQGVKEIVAQYDNQCTLNTTCTLTVNVTQDLDAPVFVYYRLTNFYQNHRRYVKSRSDTQLRGEHVLSGLSTCDPLEDYGTPPKPLYPCGLIANSFFRDTFTVTRTTGAGPLTSWTETGIAWPSDKKEKFKNATDPDAFNPAVASRTGPNGPLPFVTDEHFMVWMRTAGLPTFKKLYARMPKENGFEGLQKGDVLSIQIENVFDVAAFKGEKAIVFSTTSWLGGKNDFLGTAYIVVGVICLILGIAFFIKDRVSPRALGDMQYFNWRKNQSTAPAPLQ